MMVSGILNSFEIEQCLGSVASTNLLSARYYRVYEGSVNVLVPGLSDGAPRFACPSRRVGVRVPRKRVREKLVRVAPLTAEQKMLLAQERRIRNRFKASLTQSRSKAKRYGYVPCDATAEELVAAFAGKCHICGVPEAECNQKLHMDHCHETGKFRGWLCYHCNNLLGRAKDSEEILINALHYLMNQEEHSIE